MKPDFFLFENVKGLWRTARHREFFEELKKQLHRAGYCTTERLTNALEYGAPQDRDRILMFGIQTQLLTARQHKGKEILSFPWEAHQKYSLDDVKSLPWPDTSKFTPDEATTCPDGIPKELTVEYWFEKNDVYHHPNANDYFQPRGGLQRMVSVDEGDVSKKSYKRLHRWRYSPTVAYGNNEVHLHPYKERRLSAAEAMSLQTLPKEFELPANMTLAVYDFTDPALLQICEIADILGKIDGLMSWASDVKEYALSKALAGTRFDGWKIVEGRSTRHYSDEASVAKAVTDIGLDPYEHKLLGITAMMSLLGKKRFEETLGVLTYKPQGKPVLVPVTDKRKEINTAADDFADPIENLED